MKKKIFVLLFLSLILVISGCSGNKEEKKDGKVKLVFYYPVNVGGPVAKIVEQLTNDFNKENPDIEVEAVYTGNYDDTVTKIQTAAQGGNPPDLFVSLATQRFTMASSEMAMPLDELIAEDGEEGKKYIDDFLESFIEDSYVDGKIYSIPFQRSTMVLYYNKDIFKEAGLDPEKAPETWEELVEIAKKSY
jgi:ABC-type sugar transport system, periplasmic component